MTTIRVLLALLLFAEQQSVSPYIETFEVRVISLDVVVTDRAGNAVRGLTKDDFELFDDGRRQEITNFSEYQNVGPTFQSAQPPKEGGLENPPYVSPPPSRKFIFVVDELSLHPVTAKKLGARAIELVKSAMQPGDEAMIVTPAAKTKIALPYTSDRDAVVRSLEETMRGVAFRAANQLQNERLYFQHQIMTADTDMQALSAAQAYTVMVTRRVQNFLGELKAVVNAAAEVPGKKVLVLVSNSLNSEPGKEAYSFVQFGIGAKPLPDDTSSRSRFAEAGKKALNHPWIDLKPSIEEIGRGAATNGVTIYCLQPEAAGTVINDEEGGLYKVVSPLMPQSYIQATISGTVESFNTLADATGGKVFRGDGKIGDAFRQVADDLQSYYSLGYHAPDGEADKARKMEVRVKGRRDLQVRTRRDVVRRSVTKEMDSRVVATLLFPNEKNELGIAAQAGEPIRDKDMFVVPVKVLVPIAALTFLPDGDHVRGRFVVHYAASTEQGDFGSGQAREQIVDIPTAQFEAAKSRVFTYDTRLRVLPGEVKIAVGVLDPLSRLSGFKTVSVVAR